MSKVPLQPLGQRIVAIYEDLPNKTATGLYLPDNAKEKSQIAKILAVGPEVKFVKSNDRVVVREYSTTEVKVDSSKYIVIKEEDILAKLV